MARDFFEELGDTITKTTRDLGKKAGTLYEIQKIKGRISGEKMRIEELKAEIGNIVLEQFEAGVPTEDEIRAICEKIQQHKKILARYEDEASELKGEKICPSCKKSVDRNVSFCPFCGSPCPTPEPETMTGEVEGEEGEESFGGAEDVCQDVCEAAEEVCEGSCEVTDDACADETEEVNTAE